MESESLFPILVAGCVAIGAWMITLVVVNLVKGDRRKLSQRLSGTSGSTGLAMMGEELPQPLASEFKTCYDQHSLGTPLEFAMREMSRRIDSTDFAFFVTAVLIQRQTGGDLSQVLGNISGMIRQRTRLQQYVKAKTAEGRFTGYILVAFPILMFFIAASMNPDYKKNLLEDPTGIMLLCVAGGLVLLGLFAIRKITTVRV